LADFACDIRRIVLRQALPGYRLGLKRDGQRDVLRILPTDLSIGSVDNPVGKFRDPVDGIGTSGVAGIGTSGVGLSGLRACEHQLTLWPDMGIRPRNKDSNTESNKSLCCGPVERNPDPILKPGTQTRSPPRKPGERP
jgi:hypothetical protein